MPSVISLLEVREARAREDLESWLEMLREAEVQAEAARQRLDRGVVTLAYAHVCSREHVVSESHAPGRDCLSLVLMGCARVRSAPGRCRTVT